MSSVRVALVAAVCVTACKPANQAEPAGPVVLRARLPFGNVEKVTTLRASFVSVSQGMNGEDRRTSEVKLVKGQLSELDMAGHPVTMFLSANGVFAKVGKLCVDMSKARPGMSEISLGSELPKTDAERMSILRGESVIGLALPAPIELRPANPVPAGQPVGLDPYTFFDLGFHGEADVDRATGLIRTMKITADMGGTMTMNVTAVNEPLDLKLPAECVEPGADH